MASNASAWHATNTRVASAALTQREQSKAVRSTILNTTRSNAVQLQRSQRDVQNQLSLRIDDIQTRKMDLERAIDDTLVEIDNLTAHQELAQRELDERTRPLEIAEGNVVLRKKRTGVDLFVDGVEKQLAAEVKLIKKQQGDYNKLLNECKEQLRLLRAAHYKLEQDLQDKYKALDIDSECASLDTTSDGLKDLSISTQLNGAVVPRQWDTYTEQNLQTAAKERQKSTDLRERIDTFIKDADLEMTTQSNATEDAFNARIAEYNEARRVGDQQLTKTKLEIQHQDRSIAELKAAIDARDGPLKVASTRLEKRSQRPNVELVNDPVHASLVKELADIKASIAELRGQLNEAELVMKGLRRVQLTVEEDIAVKTNSLNIDNECMQVRQQFKYRRV